MTAKRTDGNQAEIVDALRQIGCSVQTLHEVGRGVPDLLVGCLGYNLLLEVKTRTGKLEADQVEWHAGWRGQVAVVRTAEDAIKIVREVCGKAHPVLEKIE